MRIKNIAAVFSVILIAFSLSACKSDEEAPLVQESSTNQNDIIIETVLESASYSEALPSDSVSEYNTQEPEEVVQTEAATASSESEITTTESFDDPSQWSKERIVEDYKNAARK